MTDNQDNTCPEYLETRAKILCYNGISGFQGPNDGAGKENFAICWCDDITNEQVNKIKELSGSITLVHGDFIGRYFLTIKWTGI